MYFDQQEFDIRCEWGAHGVAALAPISDVVIIVDALSFTTTVDIAVQRGAVVFPYQRGNDGAAEFAASIQAELADPKRTTSKYSLSPHSFLRVQPGERIVLPSLNGAILSLAAKPTPVLAGCLRNADSVAMAAQKYGTRIAVIPAGERWLADMSIRPAFEDLIGAGAIISHLAGSRSPEASSAVAAFQQAKSELDRHMNECSSGKELIERGFSEDVQLAAQLDVSDCAPTLTNEAFVQG